MLTQQESELITDLNALVYELLAKKQLTKAAADRLLVRINREW